MNGAEIVRSEVHKILSAYEPYRLIKHYRRFRVYILHHYEGLTWRRLKPSHLDTSPLPIIGRIGVQMGQFHSYDTSDPDDGDRDVPWNVGNS
jgi:hypothetical protein